MWFRVQNIRKGYCEVWANEQTGQRYQRLAVVMRDESSNGAGHPWVWSAKHNEPPFYMPFCTHEFGTRTECIVDVMKSALISQARRAIEQQPEESEHFHSPRRDAWLDISRNAVPCNVKHPMFTQSELDEWEQRLNTFGKEQ